MSDLQKKVITISGAETKQMSNGNMMTKLKDQDWKSYTLFHTKADNTESKAYQVLKLLPNNGIGLTKEISYSEDSFKSADGKDIVSKKIVGISSTTETPSSNTTPTFKQFKGASKKETDVDWDKIAEGKCRHGFALEAFKMCMPLNQETMNNINEWTEFSMVGSPKIKIEETNEDFNISEESEDEAAF